MLAASATSLITSTAAQHLHCCRRAPVASRSSKPFSFRLSVWSGSSATFWLCLFCHDAACPSSVTVQCALFTRVWKPWPSPISSSVRHCFPMDSSSTTASSTSGDRSTSSTGCTAEQSLTPLYWRAPGWRSRGQSFTRHVLADGHDGCRTLPGRLSSVPRQTVDRLALHSLSDNSHLRCQFPPQRSALLWEFCPVHPMSITAVFQGHPKSKKWLPFSLSSSRKSIFLWSVSACGIYLSVTQGHIVA